MESRRKKVSLLQIWQPPRRYRLHNERLIEIVKNQWSKIKPPTRGMKTSSSHRSFCRMRPKTFARAGMPFKEVLSMTRDSLLVAQVMKSLAETFSNERAKLEAQMDQTDKASTENLRVTLRRYRSFFERLLSL